MIDKKIRNPDITISLWIKFILILAPGCFLITFTLSHLDVVTSKSIKPKLLWRMGTIGQAGDYVLFDFNYPLLKKTIKVTKKIACGPGEHLDTKDHQFYCNGTWLARAKLSNQSGKTLPTFTYQGIIPDDKAFVLGSHEDSFDSRYFGFININKTEKLAVVF